MTPNTMTPNTMTPNTMTPNTMTPNTMGGNASAVGECWLYCLRMIEGLVVYDLKPQQLVLALLMLLDSYGRIKKRAPLRLEEWAEAMGLRDFKGPRCDKLRDVLKSLVCLGLVDVQEADGTFELRPEFAMWSKLRAFRRKPREGDLAGHPELKLCAERPLSEALSDLSREKVLEGARVVQSDPGTLFIRLKSALRDPALMADLEKELSARPGVSSEKSADGVGEIRRHSADKSADTKTVDLQGFAASSEKSADSLAVLAVPALVQKAGTAKGASDKSADAMRWLEAKDLKQRLQEAPIFAQWAELCNRNPKYVLDRLRWHLQFYEKQATERKEPAIEDPLAWMSRKAREEGQMRPLPGRVRRG